MLALNFSASQFFFVISPVTLGVIRRIRVMFATHIIFFTVSHLSQFFLSHVFCVTYYFHHYAQLHRFKISNNIKKLIYLFKSFIRRQLFMYTVMSTPFEWSQLSMVRNVIYDAKRMRQNKHLTWKEKNWPRIRIFAYITSYWGIVLQISNEMAKTNQTQGNSERKSTIMSTKGILQWTTIQ